MLKRHSINSQAISKSPTFHYPCLNPWTIGLSPSHSLITSLDRKPLGIFYHGLGWNSHRSSSGNGLMASELTDLRSLIPIAVSTYLPATSWLMELCTNKVIGISSEQRLQGYASSELSRFYEGVAMDRYSIHHVRVWMDKRETKDLPKVMHLAVADIWAIPLFIA